jgi:hypothetical protein
MRFPDRIESGQVAPWNKQRDPRGDLNPPDAGGVTDMNPFRQNRFKNYEMVNEEHKCDR